MTTPMTPWNPSRQDFRGGGDEENSEDGYDNPATNNGEPSSPGTGGCFYFELPSFEGVSGHGLVKVPDSWWPS